MPKKTTDSRDYGRRLYVGKEPYIQKLRKHTTAYYDWLYKLRQSESKKPYLSDDYPSMEYPFSPWTPVIPPHTPPTLPPIDPPPPYPPPQEPPYNPGNPGKPKPPHKWLGCDFYPNFFSPISIGPGELADTRLVVALDETYIKQIKIEGPADFLGIDGPGKIMATKRENSWTVPIIIRAWDAGKISADPRYKNVSGDIPVLVTVYTGSYGMDNLPGQAYTVGVCTALGFVKKCPPEVSISWDTDTSPQTIGWSTSATIAVKDGIGPYTWSVEGTGFSLAYEKTEGKVNTLIAAADSCGTADITVIDACDEQTTGAVRSTAGDWFQTDDPCECLDPGPHTNWYQPPPGISGYFARVGTSTRCYEAWEGTFASNEGDCITNDCASRCTTYQYCHTECGCYPKCITDSAPAPGWTMESPWCWPIDGGGITCVCRAAASRCEYYGCN